MDDQVASQDRRAFIGRLGKTLAAGLGFGLLASGNAFGTTNVCGIWCTDMGTSGCSGDQHYYHCVSGPCGYEYSACESRTGNYCACNNCC